MKTLRERTEYELALLNNGPQAVENIAQAVKAWLKDETKGFETKACVSTIWYLGEKIDREGEHK